MIKKYAWVIVVAVILLITVFFVRGKEDTWICQEGTWVRHGTPTAPIPTYFCDK